MATVILMLSPRDPATKAALATSLIAAVADGYQIPESRVNVFIQEFAPADRHGGRIEATVMVHALPRAIDLKRALVSNVADAVARHIEAPRERVNIMLIDTPWENSGVGGTLAVDKRAASAVPQAQS